MDNERMDISYQKVLAAAKRAKQLSSGAKPRIDEKYPKDTFMALEEIEQGKVNFQFEEDEE